MAISNNMVVALEYELRDNSTNEMLDSNIGEPALEFITGKNHIIVGLESEIVKLNSGDSATIVVAPKDGYGEYNEDALEVVPKEQFSGIDLEEGMPLYAQAHDGSTIQVIVKKLEGDEVTIDYNHPLAGKELAFDVKILTIREATDEEIATGVVGGMGNSCGCGSGLDEIDYGGGCGCN